MHTYRRMTLLWCVCCSTYRPVRVVPRPWRAPEGTVNRSSLRMMLEAVAHALIEAPGLTRSGLVAKYDPVLQPVSILELIEVG